MNKYLFLRAAACIFIFGLCLYFYLNKQNELTALRMKVPKMVKEMEDLKANNKRLQYEIDKFENPLYLMELAKSPAFSHLRHPFLKDVLNVVEGFALQEKKIGEDQTQKKRYFFPMATR